MANHNDPVEALKRSNKKPQADALPDGVKEHSPPLEPLPPQTPQPSVSGYYQPATQDPPKAVQRQPPPAEIVRANPAEQPALICKRYRVTADWRGSLYGQMIHLKTGEIVDVGHYSLEGFKRLMDGGLQATPLEEPTI